MSILSKLCNDVSVNTDFLYTFGGLSNIIRMIVRNDIEDCLGIK